MLTKEILEEMYINKQMTDEQIAKEFNCGSTTIYEYRKKYNISTLTRRTDLQQTLNKDILLDMCIEKQMTDKQIADEFNCNAQTIRRYRLKYGIKTPDRRGRKTDIPDRLTKDILIDRYTNKQMTDKQIAEEFNCAPSVVGQYRMKYNIQTLTRETELQKRLTKEVLFDLYVHKQMTDEKIANKFNCNSTTVGDYRMRYNIDSIYRSISASQREISECIRDIFIKAKKIVPQIIINDRKSISPFEIDISIPEYNFGVEFNGGFWHSEVKHNKAYHYNKSILAKEKGIFIYHIFSYEWEDKAKRLRILNQIKNLLGLNNNKIYARKCEIREVDTTEKRDFLDNNHVQGNDHATTKLGLYYHDELVSLMTFTKPRFTKKYAWELSRFCSKANCNIVGGASKLFNYFVTNYLNSGESVISYSDIAKTKGSLYEKLGFIFLHDSKPNYVWWKDDNDYKTRYQCQMKNEVQIMQSQGYHRIYDCGNKTWVYDKL